MTKPIVLSALSACAIALASTALASCAVAKPPAAGTAAAPVTVSGPPVAAPAEPPATAAGTGRDCADCPEMVPVAIGSGGAGLTLFVSRYELTWRQYLAALDEASCPKPRNRLSEPLTISDAVRDDFPMTSVSVREITCYLAWLRRKTGREYRLPTSSEWESIARTGYPAGPFLAGSAAPEIAWLLNRDSDEPLAFDEQRQAVKFRGVQRVGQLRPHPTGLYDLFGNAAEAVSDIVPPRPSMSPRAGAPAIPVARIKGGHVVTPEHFDLMSGESLVDSRAINDFVGFRLVYEGSR